MQFTMTVRMDGDAFADPGPELARILRDAADKADEGRATAIAKDVNGNTCGEWTVSE